MDQTDAGAYAEKRRDPRWQNVRLSRLQRRILAWLWAQEQRVKGSMAADHRDLVQALGHDKSNLSHSLANLAAKGPGPAHADAWRQGQGGGPDSPRAPGGRPARVKL